MDELTFAHNGPWRTYRVWDFFYMLFGLTFVFDLRTKKPLKTTFPALLLPRRYHFASTDISEEFANRPYRYYKFHHYASYKF